VDSVSDLPSIRTPLGTDVQPRRFGGFSRYYLYSTPFTIQKLLFAQFVTLFYIFQILLSTYCHSFDIDLGQ